MFLLSLGNKKIKYPVNKHVLKVICSDVSLVQSDTLNYLKHLFYNNDSNELIIKMDSSPTVNND